MESNRKQIIAEEGNDMYNFSNPKRIGPGSWYMFMLMSAHATDRGSLYWICQQIRLFCEKFGCGECSGHCKAYVKLNPPENHINGQYDLFYWVVTFMNAVNHRLGKMGYDKEYLLRMFIGDKFTFCEKNCDEIKDKEDNIQIHKQKYEVSDTPKKTPQGFVLVKIGT